MFNTTRNIRNILSDQGASELYLNTAAVTNDARAMAATNASVLNLPITKETSWCSEGVLVTGGGVYKYSSQADRSTPPCPFRKGMVGLRHF